MAEEKEVKEEKKKEREGKKPRSKSKHKNVEIWKQFKDGKFLGKWCPRCGAGAILAQHSNRIVCGRCHYSEMKVQKK